MKGRLSIETAAAAAPVATTLATSGPGTIPFEEQLPDEDVLDVADGSDGKDAIRATNLEHSV